MCICLMRHSKIHLSDLGMFLSFMPIAFGDQPTGRALLCGTSSALHLLTSTIAQLVSPLTPYYLDRLHRREAQRGT